MVLGIGTTVLIIGAAMLVFKAIDCLFRFVVPLAAAVAGLVLETVDCLIDNEDSWPGASLKAPFTRRLNAVQGACV